MGSKTIVVLSLLCIMSFGLVTAQVAKRDFSKQETVLGVPKICIDEILAFNFHKDCISLVRYPK